MVHHTAHTSGGVPMRASAGHNTDAARMAGLCGCGVGWSVADRLRDGRVLWWPRKGLHWSIGGARRRARRIEKIMNHIEAGTTVSNLI